MSKLRDKSLRVGGERCRQERRGERSLAPSRIMNNSRLFYRRLAQATTHATGGLKQKPRQSFGLAGFFGHLVEGIRGAWYMIFGVRA